MSSFDLVQCGVVLTGDTVRDSTAIEIDMEAAKNAIHAKGSAVPTFAPEQSAAVLPWTG